MENGVENVLITVHDDLDEAKSAVTHVGKSGTQVPADGILVFMTSSRQRNN